MEKKENHELPAASSWRATSVKGAFTKFKTKYGFNAPDAYFDNAQVTTILGSASSIGIKVTYNSGTFNIQSYSSADFASASPVDNVFFINRSLWDELIAISPTPTLGLYVRIGRDDGAVRVINLVLWVDGYYVDSSGRVQKLGGPGGGGTSPARIPSP